MKCSILMTISLITISLILTSQSSAKIDEQDIIGAWLFDEGSGDVVKDSAPNGFDGEVVGAEWEKNGKVGSCLEFSGVPGDNYVDCGVIEQFA